MKSVLFSVYIDESENKYNKKKAIIKIKVLI